MYVTKVKTHYMANYTTNNNLDTELDLTVKYLRLLLFLEILNYHINVNVNLEISMHFLILKSLQEQVIKHLYTYPNFLAIKIENCI